MWTFTSLPGKHVKSLQMSATRLPTRKKNPKPGQTNKTHIRSLWLSLTVLVQHLRPSLRWLHAAATSEENVLLLKMVSQTEVLISAKNIRRDISHQKDEEADPVTDTPEESCS